MYAPPAPLSLPKISLSSQARLVSVLGRKRTLATPAVPRLKCSRCGAREASLAVLSPPPKRAWVSSFYVASVLHGVAARKWELAEIWGKPLQ
jgi:hypothetical protein